MPGAVVAGAGAGGEGGGEEGLAGGGAQPFVEGPGGGAVDGSAGGVAVPADLVAGDGEGDQDLAGGGGGTAVEGVEGLAEEVVGVGEGAALGHEEAGGAVRGGGRGPAAVAAGDAAASLPAVAAQQGAEVGGVDAGGVGGPVPCGVVGVGAEPADGLVGACHGLPPVPTRVMISQRARSSKMRAVGTRTVVRVRPVTGCPARLTQ